MSSRACDACLRRTGLIARLAGAIELARHDKRALHEILVLPDDALLAALAGYRRAEVARDGPALEPRPMRTAAERAGVAAVCRHDEAYPTRLHDLDDPPAALFVAGAIAALGTLVGGGLDDGPRAVAVVGTRRASPDGHEVARALGRGLAAAGVTVVSGMALGVDSAAHAGALEVGGPTLAVLAGGADVPYPRSKRALYARIGADGCVVSELPPGFKPFRWCFPARNRIIAALSHMTIVVEAAERSGSLITAEIAADLGREVGAVPGAVTACGTRGTNALLRDGATVIRDARDGLDAVMGLGYGGSSPPPDPALQPRLQSILGAVSRGRDTLAALAGTPDQAQATLVALTELELLGRLRRVAGGRYVVIPR